MQWSGKSHTEIFSVVVWFNRSWCRIVLSQSRGLATVKP